MKNKLSFLVSLMLLLFCLSLMSTNEAHAQRKRKSKEKKEKGKKDKGGGLSRDEKKALKKEIKAYLKNMESYLAFKDAKAQAEQDLSSTKAELSRVKELEAQCAKEVEGLRAEIDELRAKLAACNNKPKGFGIPAQGKFYVVQVGAFQNADVATNDNNPDFRKESADGYNKYIMGIFSDIGQADDLKDFIMNLDFKSNPAYRPFIVPYRDGVRISIEDALGPEEAERRRQSMGQ